MGSSLETSRTQASRRGANKSAHSLMPSQSSCRKTRAACTEKPNPWPVKPVAANSIGKPGIGPTMGSDRKNKGSRWHSYKTKSIQG